MPARGKSQAAITEEFTERYSQRPVDSARLIETEVFGAAVGVNGYTTIAQADQLASVLRLGPGMRLLDIGAGIGWPGLHLSEMTGCDLVLTDVPAMAIRRAMSRAAEKKLSDRCRLAVASAVHLPFRPQSFDAIVHTDVLC